MADTQQAEPYGRLTAAQSLARSTPHRSPSRAVHGRVRPELPHADRYAHSKEPPPDMDEGSWVLLGFPLSLEVLVNLRPVSFFDRLPP